ncbi:hypothetical protein HOD20_08375 [archaeon]|jgi:hypothetical protein|nr:hypothetical protein [archaeon]MBT4647754.1 hypothetical protein [archaeon]
MKNKQIDIDSRRKVMHDFFKNKAVLTYSKGNYLLEDKLNYLRFSVLRKKDFPHLKTDLIQLNISTPEGLIVLNANHKKIIDIKRECYFYEAVFMGKKPELIHRNITPKTMAWKF